MRLTLLQFARNGSLSRHTGHTLVRLHADMELDRFFPIEQAAEYELVDRAVEKH